MKYPFRIYTWLLAMLASSALGSAAAFAAEPVTEQAVRAALVFNFIKFTEWPAVAGEPQLRICIASSDPAQLDAFAALDERRVRDKTLIAERFARQTDCGVIYVDSRQRWNEIGQRRGSGNTLTIGSYAGFAEDGGMIEISLQGGSARFDINLAETKRAGLRLYPQLLRLARRIVE